jgi:hypothetical protein
MGNATRILDGVGDHNWRLFVITYRALPASARTPQIGQYQSPPARVPIQVDYLKILGAELLTAVP